MCNMVLLCCVISRCHLARSRQRVTALRLELWLRSLCHSSSRHGGLDPYQTAFQIPDVFRLSRTLAKVISQDASSHVISLVRHGQLPNGSHRLQCEGISRSARDIANGATGFFQDTGCLEADARVSSLEEPRQALIGRLRGLPGADALRSWVSGMAQTVRQFKEWLPWQAFADELRELLQHNVQKGNGTQADPVAATAAAFALCEMLRAWEDVEVNCQDRCWSRVVWRVLPRVHPFFNSFLTIMSSLVELF